MDAQVEEGAKSEFTVWSNGELLFSKEEQGRFPEHDEIVAQLRSS